MLPAGTIGVVPGPMMAAADRFELTVQGKGGHAAMPHLSVDPVAIGAQIVMTWQTLVSRTADPVKSAVISTTMFHAGTAFNVIPDTASLCGTVRTFDPGGSRRHGGRHDPHRRSRRGGDGRKRRLRV